MTFVIPSAGATASVIVPAYNEEHRIGSLLPVLSEVAESLRYLVVVSCNGCVDRTVEMARATPGIVVLEDPIAGKARALNRAEASIGDIFPRLYVDADVIIDANSLRLLVDALRVDEPIAVRPNESYIMEGAPWLTRAFYLSKSVTPSSRRWLDEHIEGHYIYGTNAAGRRKFDVFPEEGLITEDAYFDRMFNPDEKLAVPNAQVVVPLPNSSRALLRGLTRVYQGNWELDTWLARHRPDRVIDTPARSRNALVKHVRRFVRDTFPSAHLRAVAIVLAALVMRRIAMANAKRHVRRGREADWR